MIDETNPYHGASGEDDQPNALILRYLEGQATPADVARLNAQLAADPAMQSRFVAMSLNVGLVGQCLMDQNRTAVAVSLTPPQSYSFFSLHRRSMRYALAASLILCVGVIASVMSMISVQKSTEHGTRVTVATLTESADAIFDASDVPTAAGSQLPVGFLRLKSGTAKVAFYNGAEVTLEGPCEFGINSESHGFLKAGRIAAYVPPRAHGFTVGAPKYLGSCLTQVITTGCVLGTHTGLSPREGGWSRLVA